jgi:hypothetical protein
MGLAIRDRKVQLHDAAKKYLPSVGTPPESNAKTGWLDELTLWMYETDSRMRPGLSGLLALNQLKVADHRNRKTVWKLK